MVHDAESEGARESAAEATELKAVTERLARGDGALVEVKGIQSTVGERLWVTARYGQDVTLPEPGQYFLNIDLFADRNGRFEPIGMRDFEVRNGVADGNKQRHGRLPEMSNARADERTAHARADKKWATGEGIKISDEDLLNYAGRLGGLKGMGVLRERGLIQSEKDWGKKVYQERGLGTLLNVIALLVLRQKGVERVQLGHLNKASEALWRRWEKWRSPGWQPKSREEVLVDELYNDPVVRAALLKIVRATQRQTGSPPVIWN
ncbi:MAG: hypothetical protein U0514_01435 [Candidatus Andersenbacteria bacterium]